MLVSGIFGFHTQDPAQVPNQGSSPISDLVTDLVPDLVLDLALDLIPDLVIDLVLNLVTDLVPDLVPDLVINLFPDVFHWVTYHFHATVELTGSFNSGSLLPATFAIICSISNKFQRHFPHIDRPIPHRIGLMLFIRLITG